MIVNGQRNKLRGNETPQEEITSKFQCGWFLVFGHVCATECSKTTKGLCLIYSANKPGFRNKRSTNISRRGIDIDKIRKQKVIYFTSTNDEGTYPISLLDKF